MHFALVTVEHQPDAGQRSTRRFAFETPRGFADAPTACELAFRALAEEEFQRGLVRVTFPEVADYGFHFERAGLVGYRLAPT